MGNNDNTSFHDEAPSDREMNKFLQRLNKKKLMKGVVEDDDDLEGDEYRKNLMDDDFDSDNDDDFVYRE